MALRPSVNWTVASVIARALAGPLPPVSRTEAQQIVADMRVRARLAGELAAQASGLPGSPAQQIRVVDRVAWHNASLGMLRAALESLDLPERSQAAGRSLVALGQGVVVGAGLGMLGRSLLGQFDAFDRLGTLYLIAPNLVALESRTGFDASDFRTWVAAHEQTHALQLSAAAWLEGYVRQRMARIAADDVSMRSLGHGIASGRGVRALLFSPDAEGSLEELTSTMTLLEGHADFVSDSLGRRHVRSVRALRRAFSRTSKPGWLARALPLTDKDAQYRRGLAFCRAVAKKVKMPGLNVAFSEPAALPSGRELDDPQAWVRRVHGTA